MPLLHDLTPLLMPAPMAPPPVAHPSVREVIRAGICSHRDRYGKPIYDPFVQGMSADDRQAVYDIKRGLGLTHLLVNRGWGYRAYAEHTGYAIGELTCAEHGRRIEEVRKAGLWPCVVLPFDDDQDGQDAVYDGRMRAELKQLRPLVREIGFVSLAFENAGTWRTRVVEDSLLLAREHLGPDALIALHGAANERWTYTSFHGSLLAGDPVPAGLRWMPAHEYDAATGRQWGHLIEDDDATDGYEPGCWALPGGREVDVFLWQSRHGSDGPTGTNGDPYPNSGTWSGRLIEGWERFAPPGTWFSARGRAVRTHDAGWEFSAAGKDWFLGAKKRVRAVPYELHWVEYSRGQCADARIDAVAELLDSFGFEEFGSGVPARLRP